MTLTYFTGLACPKGHYSERYASNSVCIECKKLSYKPTGNKVGNKPNEARLKALANGDKFYISGTTCKRGHTSKRHTETGRCEECFQIKRKSKEREYSINKYGINKAQYQDMLWEQNGVCKICKKPETSLNGKGSGLKPLAIDHCHETGKIRGLLCSRCNIGIGNLKHDPVLLRAAALYCEEA